MGTMKLQRTVPLAVFTAAVLVLSACTSTGEETSTGTAADEVAAESSADDSELLAGLGLADLTGQELVEQLDASPDARPLAFAASVRETEVLVSDGQTEVTVDLPQDQRYVSIAPYVDQTHDCYYHSLATCQGELAETEVEVTITDEDGEVLVDETTRTYANGFVGFWVPRDTAGTIEVTYGELTGSVPFTTTAGSATCITTLQVG